MLDMSSSQQVVRGSGQKGQFKMKELFPNAGSGEHKIRETYVHSTPLKNQTHFLLLPHLLPLGTFWEEDGDVGRDESELEVLP